jgi:hypothetical protein
MAPNNFDVIAKTRKQYNTPRLTVYGRLEEITGGFFGPYNDWINGNTSPGWCDPKNSKWGHHCPTGS